MIMPNKMYLKGNPRKFSDKIALIKQKEALSNASFQSAIHGLTEITMNRQPGREIENLEAKDNYSLNSYSPESFTSESTARSLKTPYQTFNERKDIKMDQMSVNRNSDVFNSCHELSQPNEGGQRHSYTDQVKYRHESDRSNLQTQGERYSNLEGYFPHNKNLTRVYEPGSSGSLPDVSLWRNPKEFSSRRSYENKHFRESNNSDHIDLLETLSNLEQVKLGNKSKAALLEHLKNRGLQNVPNPHPHHIQSANDQANVVIPTIISSPSLHRAAGHGHSHGDSDCAGNLNESGHLKHYSMANSPYVSLSHRDRHSTKDLDSVHRPRPLSGLVTPSVKHMKLNINCSNDYGNYGIRNKALTPTGQQSNSWFEGTKHEINSGLLHPAMFSNVLANENGRRVASDSNIQNSLKLQTERISFAPTFTDNPFERVNSLKREATSHPYQRNQSMTSYPTQNTQTNCDLVSQFADFEREISQVSVTSSLFENIFGLKSPDENLDPSLVADVNVFRTPDFSQGQIFVFNEFNNLPKVSTENIVQGHPSVNDEEYSTTDNLDSYMDSSDKRTAEEHPMTCDDKINDAQDFDNSGGHPHGHECYWEHSNDSNTMSTKELSPTIKPCENLDPKTVDVDIYTDFEGIPEITFSDVDAQRRDSLNWTDEVLKNLNSESGNGDQGQSRDRSMSVVYQPMVALAEEDRPQSDIISDN